MSFVGKCLSSLEIELNVEKMKSAGPVLLTFVIKDFFFKGLNHVYENLTYQSL